MTDRLSARSLIDIVFRCSGRASIFRTKPYTPQFSLFLGAGASHSSGVSLASEMVSEFREMHESQYPQKMLENEPWYDPEMEYATLFERLFPTASVRRDYVERILEFGGPSLGYLYLVRLLEENFFTTIFTTNFDDLLNEACYLFSANVRPMVCAHDSSVGSLRMSSTRPKILKMHGDFLFDNIRNTPRELASLESNMREKFAQYAREFGLIVIGYSGSDNSIMDIIDELLESKANFAQGIFWCVRRNTQLGKRVDRLTRFERFHVVEVDGFDEFMAEFNDALALGPPPVVDNPYRALGLRMARMLNSLPPRSESGDLHSILKRDLIALGNAVRDPAKLETMPRPHNCLASAAKQNGDFQQASQHVLNQLADPSSTVGALHNAFTLGISLIRDVHSRDFGTQLLNALKTCRVVENFPSMFERNGIAVHLIRVGEFKLALDLLDYVRTLSNGFENDWATINRAQILLRLKRKLSPDLKSRLREIASVGGCLSKFGAKIALGQGKQAVDKIESSVDGSSKVDGFKLTEIAGWPICDLLSNPQKARLGKIQQAHSPSSA